jgi:hypothetical protein
MESPTKPPKTLIRSVLDVFRGAPDNEFDPGVDIEDLERDRETLEKDSSDDENSDAAAATDP